MLPAKFQTRRARKVAASKFITDAIKKQDKYLSKQKCSS